MKGCLTLVLIVVLGLMILRAIEETPDPESFPSPLESHRVQTSTPPWIESIDKSREAQDKRRKIIADLTSGGIVQKNIWGGSLPHLWVTPAFLSLDFDDKASCCGVVWMFWAVERPPFGMKQYGEPLVLKDSINGKRIGSYSPSRGLELN